MSIVWQQIAAVVAADSAERLGDALSERGALAVTLEDAADEPLYEPPIGTTPLWQTTRVTALFDAGADFEAITLDVGNELNLGAAAWRITPLADQTWERVWMDRFEPMRFGARLWICPSHREVTEADAIVIKLDPGLAFGTGTHPTTALCLEALEGMTLNDVDVLDYGCGSGVLAIAALKLGAASARAVDIDPQAIVATQNNAADNDVVDQITAAQPRSVEPASADVVMANILAGPLVELAPTLAAAARPGAQLVLSGILRTQAAEVSAAYAADFDMQAPVVREEWVSINGRRHA